MSQEVYKHTVIALFEGRCTPLQKALITKFLSEPENQELYFQWLEEWESQNPQLITDAEGAYQQFLREVGSEREKLSPIRPLERRWALLLGIAASILVVLSVGAFAFRDKLLNHEYQTAYGEIKTYTLIDGSRVTLNANSILRVPRFGFGSGTREVFLSGEAEFAVQHLPNDQRFIVRTPDQLEVEVLGTEFVVYSRSRGSKVVLNKGRVQLRSLKKEEEKPLIINPGDVVTISNQGDLKLKHHQQVAVHTGWKDHRFIFDNTPISEIASRVSETFGVQLIIADSALSKRTLGGTFKAETAEKFLQVMAEILEVRIVPNTSSSENPQTYTLTY